MNKPPDETLKQGRNRSWLLVQLGELGVITPKEAIVKICSRDEQQE